MRVLGAQILHPARGECLLRSVFFKSGDGRKLQTQWCRAGLLCPWTFRCDSAQTAGADLLF